MRVCQTSKLARARSPSWCKPNKTNSRARARSLSLEVSVWLPAFFEADASEAVLATAHAYWTRVFAALPRLDHLFVPGGDPGGRAAPELFAIVARMSALAKATYPACKVWVSSQYGLACSVDLGLLEARDREMAMWRGRIERAHHRASPPTPLGRPRPPRETWRPLEREAAFFAELARPEVAAAVDGVVYGPWSAVPIDEFRARVPACAVFVCLSSGRSLAHSGQPAKK